MHRDGPSLERQFEDLLRRIADEVMRGKRDPSKFHWIGVYPVSYAYSDHYGFWFSVRGSNTRFPDCRGNYDYTADSGFVFSKNNALTAYGFACAKLSTSVWYADSTTG